MNAFNQHQFGFTVYNGYASFMLAVGVVIFQKHLIDSERKSARVQWCLSLRVGGNGLAPSISTVVILLRATGESISIKARRAVLFGSGW